MYASIDPRGSAPEATSAAVSAFMGIDAQKAEEQPTNAIVIPYSSASGLNLQKVSHTIIFYTPIDLEHAQCYNASNHWSALASVSRKYVFHARTGVEQLFDLAADPGETVDLGRNGSYADELALWRARLVAQFEAEGRGAQFVDANGTLVWPRENVLYSPYYPAGR